MKCSKCNSNLQKISVKNIWSGKFEPKFFCPDCHEMTDYPYITMDDTKKMLSEIETAITSGETRIAIAIEYELYFKIVEASAAGAYTSDMAKLAMDSWDKFKPLR